MNRKIIFLRNKNGSPCGCLAIELTRSKKCAKYQVSTLNPIDQFDRELARVISLGRLSEQPFCAPIHGNISSRQISKDVMTSLASNKSVPARASRAAKRWLKGNPHK